MITMVPGQQRGFSQRASPNRARQGEPARTMRKAGELKGGEEKAGEKGGVSQGSELASWTDELLSPSVLSSVEKKPPPQRLALLSRVQAALVPTQKANKSETRC